MLNRLCLLLDNFLHVWGRHFLASFQAASPCQVMPNHTVGSKIIALCASVARARHFVGLHESACSLRKQAKQYEIRWCLYVIGEWGPRDFRFHGHGRRRLRAHSFSCLVEEQACFKDVQSFYNNSMGTRGMAKSTSNSLLCRGRTGREMT